MTNQKTNEADHDELDIEYLIILSEKSRMHFIKKLEELDDPTLFFKALHPRLQIMMRPVDIAFFTAGHDDHHLASIRGILNLTG